MLNKKLIVFLSQLQSQAMKTGFVKCYMALVGLVFCGICFNTFASDDYSYPVSFPINSSTYTVKTDGYSGPRI